MPGVGRDHYCRKTGFVEDRVVLSTLLVVLVLSSLGCASIPTEPFEKFSNSLIELDQGTKKAVNELVPLSEDRFKSVTLTELSNGDTDNLESLRIPAGDNPFAISISPLFLKTQQFGIGAAEVTGAMAEYGNLLKELAAPELLPEEKFDQLAEDLNANAFNAISKMNTDEDNQIPENVAIVSTLAVEAARIYLESKRKKNLKAVLVKNQSAVADYSERMQAAVRIIALSYKNEYEESYVRLAQKAIPENTRVKAIEDLIALDRAHIENLKTLRSLHDAFGTIPQAHESLARALENPGASLDSIVFVFESGKRLQEGYEQALKSNRVSAIQAKVDAASSRADAAESDAQAALLKADLVNLQAVEARIDADNANPANEKKGKKAERLATEAARLYEIAKIKQTQAETLRESATAIENSANDLKSKLGGS